MIGFAQRGVKQAKVNRGNGNLSETTTLHLTPREVWDRQKDGKTYVPEAFAQDGFIHCTDGDENLLEVANHFYRSDPREFVVLTLAVDHITAEVKYEEAGRIYPHIYGPLNVDAVIGERTASRGAEGEFLSFK
jgi:uncharacterized protein (DUF952 family)